MYQRPGVMLYFDIMPALEQLDDAQAGQLLKAVMEYGKYGVVPALDGMAGVAWSFLRAALDRDAQTYELKCLKSEYANYCKQQRKAGEEASDFDTWMESRDAQKPTGRNRTEPDGTGRFPTTGTTSVPAPAPVTAAEANPVPAPTTKNNLCSRESRKGKGKECEGGGGENRCTFGEMGNSVDNSVDNSPPRSGSGTLPPGMADALYAIREPLRRAREQEGRSMF